MPPKHSINIRLLEADNNKRGDLFGTLIEGVFIALGYEDFRSNIHKSGREVDLEAKHRTEPRRVIAECKATKDEIGGSDINKFVGSLDAEKRKYPDQQTIGYFISLAGFTQTAIEQEKETGNERVVLLNGDQVVKELVNGRIIVPEKQAMQLAGRCAAEQPSSLLPEPKCELLAHELGWIWAVYFTSNKQRTHFVLIHADGQALATKLAEKIIASDKQVNGSLHSLTYLSPSDDYANSGVQIESVKNLYLEYLARECGEVQLEGLPADQEVGSRRLNLEAIFVPLHLVESTENAQSSSTTDEQNQLSLLEAENSFTANAARVPTESAHQRQSVGSVIAEFPRLAILGLPGGGKSTLLKRLAVAYAFPERRAMVSDELPDRSWLPLFIRCRQLENVVKSPITEILLGIPKRAEMNEESAKVFTLLVTRALRSGDVLLLIDGLDEISDEGDRICFVNQLRTFLATYPGVNIVVTSREAGFRVIGGALSTHCKHYKLDDFDDKDIKRLTLAWHKEVVGDKPDVLTEAEKLAETICDTDRVRKLAQNPLLLTTLLLVKRWVGQLPTRRSVLYGKAIEVLLMTWNVEGHAPLDQEEVLPQLEFVAFTMMNEGVKRISSKRLRELLVLARKQMPEVLGYAQISVSEFVDRVESRSSLLMLSGHDIEAGTLYPMYEFRHLTFQEYLTAKAIVDGYYPDRKDTDNLLSMIEPHLADETWQEVIPIAAVLAGRKVQPLAQTLIDRCKSTHISILKTPKNTKDDRLREVHPANLLAQCILDEIQIPPDILREGFRWIAKNRRGFSLTSHILSISRSRYAEAFREVCEDEFVNNRADLLSVGGTLADSTLDRTSWISTKSITHELHREVTSLLDSADPVQRAIGSLNVMVIAYNLQPLPNLEKRGHSVETKKALISWGGKLAQALCSDETYTHFAAAWAFAWLGATKSWIPNGQSDVYLRLLELWRRSHVADVRYVAAWAFYALPVTSRESLSLSKNDVDLIDFVKKQHSTGSGG